MLTNKYIYHIKPTLMQGHLLYPLNDLKNIYPKVYESEVSKYKGRKELLNNKIPGFNILWGDVVHCSPIHPSKIITGLLKAGKKPEEKKTNLWFKIPIERIKNHQVIWYRYKYWTTKGPFKFAHDDFEEFSQDMYHELDELPAKTLQYFKKCTKAFKKPFLFHYVPHVLVKGPINIRDVDVWKFMN